MSDGCNQIGALWIFSCKTFNLCFDKILIVFLTFFFVSFGILKYLNYFVVSRPCHSALPLPCLALIFMLTYLFWLFFVSFSFLSRSSNVYAFLLIYYRFHIAWLSKHFFNLFVSLSLSSNYRRIKCLGSCWRQMKMKIFNVEHLLCQGKLQIILTLKMF